MNSLARHKSCLSPTDDVAQHVTHSGSHHLKYDFIHSVSTRDRTIFFNGLGFSVLRNQSNQCAIHVLMHFPSIKELQHCCCDIMFHNAPRSLENFGSIPTTQGDFRSPILFKAFSISCALIWEISIDL